MELGLFIFHFLLNEHFLTAETTEQHRGNTHGVHGEIVCLFELIVIVFPLHKNLILFEYSLCVFSVGCLFVPFVVSAVLLVI